MHKEAYTTKRKETDWERKFAFGNPIAFVSYIN
jgi:hypothetical protein